MSRLALVAVLVDDYDPAIAFFVDGLGFELVEDTPSLTNDARPKRWVVVRPSGAETGILLARADGADQAAAVGGHVASQRPAAGAAAPAASDCCAVTSPMPIVSACRTCGAPRTRR
jgi:catechol 2,3-dioxygenase-like lactoylglutathione lyase family enzyme